MYRAFLEGTTSIIEGAPSVYAVRNWLQLVSYSMHEMVDWEAVERGERISMHIDDYHLVIETIVDEPVVEEPPVEEEEQEPILPDPEPLPDIPDIVGITAREAIALVKTIEEELILELLLAAESAGEARATVINAISAQLDHVRNA